MSVGTVGAREQGLVRSKGTGGTLDEKPGRAVFTTPRREPKWSNSNNRPICDFRDSVSS
jgi:hypothetical protein